MPNFGELLTLYIERAGITDAELARATGVQRQTIFRWKEGHTARPRYREDVLRIAAKLRLTPAERDELLLAAGFSPEQGSAIVVPAAAVTEQPAPAQPDTAAAAPAANEAPDPPVATGARPRARRRLVDRPELLLGVALAIMLAVAALGTVALRTFFPLDPTPPATPIAADTPLPAPTPTPAPTATPIVAADGQQLLVIAPFVGYTSSDLRFNIAGRIQEALQEELRRAGLSDVQVVIWPEPIVGAAQADAVLEASRAALAVWGEYDAGRVRAGVSVPQSDETYWVNPVDAPERLPLVINDDVPRDARVFAMLALGHYFRNGGDEAKALAVYERALAQSPTDPATEASLQFLVAVLLPTVRGYTPQALTQAIEHYSAVLALRPDWDNARYNRGTAYLGRALLSLDERDDLDAAVTDLSAVIERQPQRVDPLLNRGIAYYQRNGEGDQTAAIADFSQAITLQPDNYQGYFHRALAAIRMGEAATWQTDLARVHELRPDYTAADNALCWGYGTAGDAATALPYCDAAVAADPSGASYDSRAITLGQLGRHAEAAADLRAYLAWVDATYPLLYAKYRGPQVESWIEMLDTNENPFTPAVLDALRKG
ncbi:MAG: helix-turn-helix domain-containing protein [Caldilinea sp.]|nr:helix-turn-helix domain-containing protein [Caldilinea sp.]